MSLALFSCTSAPKYRAGGRAGTPSAGVAERDTARASAPVTRIAEPSDSALAVPRDTAIAAAPDTSTIGTAGPICVPGAFAPPLREFEKRRIMSPFGRRAKPGARGSSSHEGIDIDAETGEEVLAAAAGKVSFAGRRRGYGNIVTIDQGNGISTSYAHLFAACVRKGDIVEPGDVIGKVGSGGTTTGSHLHFEVRRDGVAVDPAPYLWLDSRGPDSP